MLMSPFVNVFNYLLFLYNEHPLHKTNLIIVRYRAAYNAGINVILEICDVTVDIVHQRSRLAVYIGHIIN